MKKRFACALRQEPSISKSNVRMPHKVKIGKKVLCKEVVGLSMWQMLLANSNLPSACIKKTSSGVYYVHLFDQMEVKTFLELESSDISQTLVDDNIIEFWPKVSMKERLSSRLQVGYVLRITNRFVYNVLLFPSGEFINVNVKDPNSKFRIISRTPVRI